MERPLAMADFKHVKIRQEWNFIDFLGVIAEVETERFDAIEKEKKLTREKSMKMPMPIVEDHRPNPANKAMIRRKRDVEIIKTVSRGSKSKESSHKNQCCGGQAELPLNFQLAITEMGGCDWRLVLEKNLLNSDVNTVQSRFSLPPGKIRPGSLESEEMSQAGMGQGTAVRFIKPSGEELNGGLVFKRWKLGANFNYVLNGRWNLVATVSRLEKDDLVQLWSFRVGSELGFALVNFGQQGKRAREEEDKTGGDRSVAKRHREGTSEAALGEETSPTFFQFL